MKKFTMMSAVAIFGLTIWSSAQTTRPSGGQTTQPLIALTTQPGLDGNPRTPIVAPAAGQTLEISMKDLGNFDYDQDKGGDIPPDVLKLEGVHFRTAGFMVPLDQAISEFALLPKSPVNYFEHNPPPGIQLTIVVHCPKGKAADYYPDQLVVEGTLHVREKKDGEFIVSIFEIDATSVKPVEKPAATQASK